MTGYLGREMIFDRSRPDHAYTDPCVLLGPHLPRAAAGGPRDPAEVVKRKSVGFRLLVYPSVYMPARLPVRRHLRLDVCAERASRGTAPSQSVKRAYRAVAHLAVTLYQMKACRVDLAMEETL